MIRCRNRGAEQQVEAPLWQRCSASVRMCQHASGATAGRSWLTLRILEPGPRVWKPSAPFENWACIFYSIGYFSVTWAHPSGQQALLLHTLWFQTATFRLCPWIQSRWNIWCQGICIRTFVLILFFLHKVIPVLFYSQWDVRCYESADFALTTVFTPSFFSVECRSSF